MSLKFAHNTKLILVFPTGYELPQNSPPWPRYEPMNIETIENGQWASGELELTHVLEIRFAHLQNSFVWIFTKDFLLLRASSTFDT